jgi:predicted nucleic acid-binding protein
MPIVDTSVVLTVLLNEPMAEIAERALAHEEANLHAPDVLGLEIANALVNAIRSKRLSPGIAIRLMEQALSLPITLHETSPLVSRAFDLSLKYQRRPYDGVFLALAERMNDVMFTTDRRLVNGMAGTPLEQSVRLIGTE